ncbi:MAG: cytochrome C [Desulfuromonadales bacterium]|nr:MAG: cytochrome C [Desulfuromonadales bacterium]
MLASVPCVVPAHAMSAFSRKYGMKCDSCHRQRIPELNDFGVAFYKNGFVLPGQDGAAKKDAAGSAAAPKLPGKDFGNSGEGAVKQDPSRAAAQGALASGAGEDESEEDVVEKEPPPPTVVYRLPSRDGSAYFTDNPARKGDPPVAKEKQGRRPPVKQGRVVQPERPASGVKPRMHSRDSVPVSQEHFRSYEECMERSLLGEPPPLSAEEIMDRLTAAEKRCSSYQSTKR